MSSIPCLRCVSVTEPMLNVVNQASLSEGDGFVEDFFVVKKQAESELPLSFSIKVDTHGSSELGIVNLHLYPSSRDIEGEFD